MHHRLRHAIVPLTVLVLSGVSTGGQSPRTLSLEAIYDPAARVDFSGPPTPNVSWIDDTSYVTVRRSGGGGEWQRVDAVSGRESALFDAGRMEAAIAALPGVGRERARTAARSTDLTFNPARSAVLFELSDDLYVYDFAANVATRLTQEAGAELEPAFSPDGRRVAFVRHNNLVVTDVAATPRERRLTSDGGPQILNGRLDWLYQEGRYARYRSS
jgi:dipeptidyl-peptidase-4